MPVQDRWSQLRRFTPARIALGAIGHALPTPQVLDLQQAHAEAKDALYTPLEDASIQAELALLGIASLTLESAAPDRDTYLKRPDLGRILATPHPELPSTDIALVIADGLSPLAVNRHAIPLLNAMLPLLPTAISPVVLVKQGRVAIADEIGFLLKARLSAILIGERPGLSSPDSLGVYITYSPRPGRTDAERNCISNIRHDGLSYESAARRIAYLIREALHRQLTGVHLKDESETLAIPSTSN
ncbi:MAG: ethanolamine ammonia-lyase subunit EutC [Bryobacterales bacterium]|nr:ethanolamine ammonia-lyase subunit EutC [Bryobacterales bacterium]